MIKVALITLASAGALGTGTQAISPSAIELNAGTVTLSAGTDGVKTKIAEKADYALRITTKSGRVIAIRF